MSRFWRSALVIGLSLMASACGRKGPLIYQDMLVPAAPAATSARQSGSAVKLNFTLPDRDRAGSPLRGIVGLKIGRRTAETDQKDVCRSCMTDYMPYRTLYLDHLPATTQRFGNSLIMLDGDVNAGNSYSYSIVSFTADGVDGASAATADVRVAVPLPAPVLSIESLPTEVKLRISSQPLNSGRLLGYNLYRYTAANARSFLPINKEPLTGGVYVDSGLERSVKYIYSARTLVQQASGGVMESTESKEVEGLLKDDE